jgi:hypothetical protein
MMDRLLTRLHVFTLIMAAALALLILVANSLGLAAQDAGTNGKRVTAVSQSTSPFTGTITATYYLPVVRAPRPPMPPPLPPPAIFTGTEPVDFAAAAAALNEIGLELAHNKIGFHHGMGGIAGDDPEFVQMLEELDAAGVPIFLKSVDNAQPIYIAQELMRTSGVSHTLVFRRVSGPDSSYDYDVPIYTLPPAVAAQLHWQKHMEAFPPELDPSLIWLETINEVDKERSDWLAEFALATAQIALAEGFRWAAFGWSSGEPERMHWESPWMLAFLQLAGEHPDQIAIALHEYSYNSAQIGHLYPNLLGRFQELFDVCDAHGIPRPTVLITEWGWEYASVPTPQQALADIAWATWLYAAYPEVKGAAIWYLGGGFGDVHQQARLLITPVRDYSLTHYFGYMPGIGGIDPLLFLPHPPTPLTQSAAAMTR